MNLGLLKATAIAYSTIFSLAPLFIVLIAIAGPLLGSHTKAGNQLLRDQQVCG